MEFFVQTKSSITILWQIEERSIGESIFHMIGVIRKNKGNISE